MLKRATISFFQLGLFTNDNHRADLELKAALFFAVFIVFGLALDSVYFAERYFDGRWLMNIFSICHFIYFFKVARTELRKLMFFMVFLGYLGEEVFCNWFDMYDYRSDQIPLYVPFGHAILYATGWVCSRTTWAKKHKRKLTTFFILFFAVVLFGVGIAFFDVLTLIYAVGFFLVMKRKRWASLYFFMSIWVIALELVGTYYQCWGWHPIVFGFIPTINPPLGALFIYVCGDIVLNKLTHYVDRKYIRLHVVSS